MAQENPEPRPENAPSSGARRGGCRRLPLLLLVALLGCLGTVLAAVIIAGLLGLSAFPDLVDSFRDAFAPPSRAVVTSNRTIVSSIRPLGQLINVNAEVVKSDVFVDIQEGVLNVCGHSAHHVAEGAVEAGVDLTLVTEDDISYDSKTNTYTLTIPHPQLTSCRVDFIRQYDRSFSTCPTINWDEARILAQYEAINEFREDALAGGVVEQARQEAILFLANFVETLTDSNAEIVINTNMTPAVGESCLPLEPPGWSYLEAEDIWLKE